MQTICKKIRNTKRIASIVMLLFMPFSSLLAQSGDEATSGLVLIGAGFMIGAMILLLVIGKILRNEGVIKSNNLHGKLLIYLVISFSFMAILYDLFASGSNTVNTLIFSSLPYVALAIFIIGSIIRYKSTEYKVSSLSSQFLEGKKLFLGSQLFHWSIIFLFFGHLAAFLFPGSVLAWNSMPVRLLILEVSGFVFGISALVGVLLLAYRRMTTKRVLAVSNNMDMVVYLVLLIQIATGLFVAYSHRWGSSWFASVLTPYLKSIFVFSPDASAVSAMPWMIKMHIFSAFFIIAIIPFTRFMHFLVAPIDYIWRSYQQVYWNWDKRTIRTNTKHHPGKPIKNH